MSPYDTSVMITLKSRLERKMCFQNILFGLCTRTVYLGHKLFGLEAYFGNIFPNPYRNPYRECYRQKCRDGVRNGWDAISRNLYTHHRVLHTADKIIRYVMWKQKHSEYGSMMFFLHSEFRRNPTCLLENWSTDNFLAQQNF